MPDSIVTPDERLSELGTAMSALSRVQWRTLALLLGSTCLTLFWLTSTTEIFFKMPLAVLGVPFYKLRIVGAFPLALNGLAWLVWMAPEYSAFREDTSFSRNDDALLEQSEIVRDRFRQASRTYRKVAILVGLQLAAMAVLTSLIFLSAPSMLPPEPLNHR